MLERYKHLSGKLDWNVWAMQAVRSSKNNVINDNNVMDLLWNSIWGLWFLHFSLNLTATFQPVSALSSLCIASEKHTNAIRLAKYIYYTAYWMFKETFILQSIYSCGSRWVSPTALYIVNSVVASHCSLWVCFFFFFISSSAFFSPDSLKDKSVWKRKCCRKTKKSAWRYNS